MKAIELKKGHIITDGESSYVISDFSFRGEGDFRAVNIVAIKVTCLYCGENLEKLGKIENQYKCVECNSPNYIDNRGNRL